MKKQFKGFVQGFLIAVLLLAFAAPSFALWQKQATLNYNSIKITLDGQAVTPKDANGNTVEPFTIDGTTYLPVRAVANALGLGLSWDAPTNTVKLTNSSASPSGTVLYENNGIKITYLGISPMEYGGEQVKLYIENSTDKKYIVQIGDSSVNGIMAYALFSCTVAAGKSAYDSIDFYSNTLSEINVSSIKTVDFIFHIYNDENYSDNFDSDIITVNK